MKSKQTRHYRSRDSLDRRVDNWIETGRQFVDGVAGNRPGKRRSFNISRYSSSSLDSVGRWVGEKIDWFMEDDDDWEEPWEQVNSTSPLSKKKPLDAISRRASNNDLPLSNRLKPTELINADEWPDDSAFRIDRWERDERGNNDNRSDQIFTQSRQAKTSQKRRLPRSSRRRQED